MNENSTGYDYSRPEGYSVEEYMILNGYDLNIIIRDCYAREGTAFLLHPEDDVRFHECRE